jgi:hypothetical protein
MQLTPRETKMLANMRKQQVQWVKLRWPQLIMSLVFMIAFFSLFVRSVDLMKDGSMIGLATFALFVPLTLFFSAFSAYKIGHTLVEWHGNPERTLLLKLIDEVEGKKPQNSEPEGPSCDSQARRT